MGNKHAGDRSRDLLRFSQDIVNVEGNRDGLERGIVTLCFGGGEGIAFESIV